MKKVAIMQPYFMPYIGYFQLINAVDEFVIYDDVQYIKRGWINRNNILINGERYLFTISVANASMKKLINEVEIADDFEKFRKTIISAYAKAPYFNAVLPLIDSIIQFDDKNIARFIANSLTAICEYLDIDTPLIFSSDLQNDKAKKGQEKILDICKMRGAKRYINPIGGQEIYSRDLFYDNDIDLKFIKSKEIIYRQFKEGFEPGLSIIDIMMFNSPAKIKELLNNYELI